MHLYPRTKNPRPRSKTTKTRNTKRLQTRTNTTNTTKHEQIRNQTRQTTRNTNKPKHHHRPPTNHHRNQTTTTRQNHQRKLHQNHDNHKYRRLIPNRTHNPTKLPTHLNGVEKHYGTQHRPMVMPIQ